MTTRTTPEWNPSDIEVGKPVKKAILQRVMNNDINHEERIEALEQTANKVEVFNFEVMGFINNYSASELAEIGTFKAAVDFQLIEANLTLLNAVNGSSSSLLGSLSIDLKRSVDNGVTWVSILESQPTIPDGTNATGSTSGFVSFVPGGNLINQGEWIRVDVVTKKDVQGSFHIHVYGEV